jgi:hypothetical protein
MNQIPAIRFDKSYWRYLLSRRRAVSPPDESDMYGDTRFKKLIEDFVPAELRSDYD